MSPSGILTLLTDFGESDAYVAAMKGVILRRAPGVRVVDITHAVPPQDVLRGAFLLAEAAPWFPPGTVHVVVVDPGVGSARRPIAAFVGDQVVVGPDNGLITCLADALGGCRSWELSRPGLGLSTLSATFHGRDLFAPAAALLAAGALAPWECGAEITPRRLGLRAPLFGEDRASGEVIAVDHFGNLVTNLRADRLPPSGLAVTAEGRGVPSFVQTYSQAAPGEVVALFGSGGWLEIAVVEGSAAQRLGLGRGAAVEVRWRGQDVSDPP